MSWYALHIASNHERKVQDALQFHRLEGFAPFYQPNPKARNRYRQPIFRPLFPGYVFSRFELDERTRVRRIPGVIRILGIGQDEPLPVPDQEIQSIRTLLESPALIQPCGYVEAGQYVRIAQGPLMGVEGFVAYVKDTARVIVSIEMLHRSVSTEVNTDWLVKAAAPREKAA